MLPLWAAILVLMKVLGKDVKLDGVTALIIDPSLTPSTTLSEKKIDNFFTGDRWREVNIP